ncbi:hypothetical protein EVA_08735 [gut metagenome]|uniref:DUF4834 family protein n=1 Tax=gut metagenome TaxID=749906 RepID=J9CSI2_9ZZZZ
MHAFLGCLGFIVFGIFIIMFAGAINILKLIFRIRKAKKGFQHTMDQDTYQNQDPYTHSSQDSDNNRQRPSHQRHNRNNRKIFDKSEGEYVDFEDIK